VKLATWNVNSIRARLPHVLDWLSSERPDILCLQETKVVDAEFPYLPLQAAGYRVVHAGQKSYNGVAILTRGPAAEPFDTALELHPEQKRLIALSTEGVRVVNVYAPNGERVGSDKYEFKLRWFATLHAYLSDELQRHPLLAVVGDFNVAPEDRDVYDPRLWRNQVLFSEPERAALRGLMKAGFIDVFRRFEQPSGSFSWWDYRQGAFRRNLGLRIDHILCSAKLAEICRSCTIDRRPRALERPSDHAPVVAEFAD
jgi:exodeoxyribonuclease III